MMNCRAVTLIHKRPPGSVSVATKPIRNEPVRFTINVPAGKASPNRRATTPESQYRATPPKALPRAIQKYSVFKRHCSNKFMSAAKGKTSGSEESQRRCDQRWVRDARPESRPNPQTRMSALHVALSSLGVLGKFLSPVPRTQPHPLVIMPSPRVPPEMGL